MTLARRDLLKVGAAGGAALVIPIQRNAFTGSSVQRMPTRKLPKPFSLPFVRPMELQPVGSADMDCYDGSRRSYPRYEISQTFTVASILPGYKTPVFGYNGLVPGPTIRTVHDQPIVVNQRNLLHQPPAAPYQSVPMPSRYTSDPWQRSTSTHLHGSCSLPQYDGYASDITFPGQWKRYFYPNCQEARTIWYHDHGIHHTSHNAYNGLAGMYIHHDAHEATLGIPTGAPGSDPGQRQYDVPLVVRDAMFATDGTLIYDDNSESGVYGDVILMNGVPWPLMDVEPRLYRFRVLNASLSRSYTWQLHDGRSAVPITMVATDAGLMPQPMQVASFRHGMAERYEFCVDFSRYKGATVRMMNLGPDNNIDYSTTAWAMAFRVGRSVSSKANNAVPADWAARVPAAECMTWTESELLAAGTRLRTFDFHRSNGQWQINGETWEDVIDSGYQHCVAEPDYGDVEIWELKNKSGGWFHPVHIHLVDFQVLSRNGSVSNVLPHEKGPKDVVYVGENETVRVAMRFAGPSAGEGWPNPRGRYMMHCHNLVHEDHDMMVQFSVGDPEHEPAFDPITADAARDM